MSVLPIKRISVLCVLLAAMLAGNGCTSTETYKALGSPSVASGKSRVLLMPPDVKLYEMTLGGSLVPKADWTDQARKNVIAALDRLIEERQSEMIRYSSGNEDDLFRPEDLQIVKRHEVVGGTIIIHKFFDYNLPTKTNKFDWTLGRETQKLREAYGADYALFINFHDTFASAGRVAAMVLTGLFTYGTGAAAIGGGTQSGFASLVDLRTGDIVWFNALTSGVGDLREADLALEASETLLTDIPL